MGDQSSLVSYTSTGQSSLSSYALTGQSSLVGYALAGWYGSAYADRKPKRKK